MNATLIQDGSSLAAGLLLVRLVVGLAFAAHGTQKLFGWFGGYGIAGTGGFLESLGFRPGARFALLAGLTETAAGLLLALGLLGPVGPALVVMTMLVAAATVHARNGFFAGSNGFELNLLYAAAVLPFAFVGHGAWSLDAALGLAPLFPPVAGWIALALAIVGGLGNLALRRSAPAPVAVNAPVEQPKAA